MSTASAGGASTQIFAQYEQEAYWACLEWPLYLMLRQRQLEVTLQHTVSALASPTLSGKTSHDSTHSRRK